MPETESWDILSDPDANSPFDLVPSTALDNPEPVLISELTDGDPGLLT